MNFSEIISLMQLRGGAKLVSVRMLDQGTHPFTKRGRDDGRSYQDLPNPDVAYTYKSLTVDNPQPGDLVVVEARDHFKLATIIAVLPARLQDIGYDQLKHVIARVDTSAMDRVRASECQARESLAMAEINERLASVARNIPGGNIGALQAMLTIEGQVVEPPAPFGGQVPQ